MQTASADAAHEVARELPQHIARLSRFLYRCYDGDLSRTEAGVLSTLSHGRRRITELAELEGLAQPTVTVLVGKMEDRGLVSRERDPDDGRVVLVAVTDEGREALERLRTQYRDLLHERMASMTDKEVAALRAATETLGALLEALQQGD
ncbi:MAG TPA: MarR family transcriptional regulator [Thermoleophilaceae bacterium]|jgi:DNA-binding MarR family transcriptional regulator